MIVTMEVWDVLVVLPFDAMVRIVDFSGQVLFAGKRRDVPMGIRDMAVERLVPCHSFVCDCDYLWIEVI